MKFILGIGGSFLFTLTQELNKMDFFDYIVAVFLTVAIAGLTMLGFAIYKDLNSLDYPAICEQIGTSNCASCVQGPYNYVKCAHH